VDGYCASGDVAPPYLDFTGLALVYFLKSLHYFSTRGPQNNYKYLAYDPRTTVRQI
jgi:hypothetical protein